MSLNAKVLLVRALVGRCLVAPNLGQKDPDREPKKWIVHMLTDYSAVAIRRQIGIICFI